MTTNIENEIWKDVPEYEGLYQVSNIGRVKHLGRIDRMGRLKPAGILTNKRCTNGYLFVKLSAFDSTKKMNLIHRVVAKAFLPNPDNKPQVNHKNGIKYDNRLENLEWCTIGQNNAHAIRTGLRAPLIKRGSESGVAKLDEKTVYEIRSNPGRLINVQLAKKYNVNKSTIGQIVNRKTWRHI